MGVTHQGCLTESATHLAIENLSQIRVHPLLSFSKDLDPLSASMTIATQKVFLIRDPISQRCTSITSH